MQASSEHSEKLVSRHGGKKLYTTLTGLLCEKTSHTTVSHIFGVTIISLRAYAYAVFVFRHAASQKDVSLKQTDTK